MIKKIIKAVIIIAILFTIVVAFRPNEFRVERSTKISAPAEIVFENVNNFHNWDAWSPWAKLDPNSTGSFEGPKAGVGAVLNWAGNDEVGVGNMVITESIPAEKIGIELKFEKPFKATNQVIFTFQSEGDATLVSWTMSGKNNFVAKAVGLFMDCEKMVGDKFEEGLSSMKKISEDTAQSQ